MDHEHAELITVTESGETRCGECCIEFSSIETHKAELEHTRELIRIKLQATLVGIPLAMMVLAFMLETLCGMSGGRCAWHASEWMITIFTAVCTAAVTNFYAEILKIRQKK